MASEWPAWVVLYDDRMRRASDPYEAFSLSDDNWPWRVSLEKEAGMYIRRDAARAWQAFRDWLNFGDLDEADNMYGDEWETQS